MLSAYYNRITLSGHDTNTVYKVFSITGKQVSQGKVIDDVIELNILLPGIYLINFVMDNRSVTKRIIKK